MFSSDVVELFFDSTAWFDLFYSFFILLTKPNRNMRETLIKPKSSSQVIIKTQ